MMNNMKCFNRLTYIKMFVVTLMVVIYILFVVPVVARSDDSVEIAYHKAAILEYVVVFNNWDKYGEYTDDISSYNRQVNAMYDVRSYMNKYYVSKDYIAKNGKPVEFKIIGQCIINNALPRYDTYNWLRAKWCIDASMKRLNK